MGYRRLDGMVDVRTIAACTKCHVVKVALAWRWTSWSRTRNGASGDDFNKKALVPTQLLLISMYVYRNRDF